MFGITNYNYNDKSNFQGLYKVKRIQMNNCAQTYSKLQELSAVVERVVPEKGKFSEIKTKYKNNVENLDVNDITLTVKPSILLDKRPKERELEISVTSKDKLSNYARVLKRGEKQEILDFMKNEGLPYEVEQFLREASDNFAQI